MITEDPQAAQQASSGTQLLPISAQRAYNTKPDLLLELYAVILPWLVSPCTFYSAFTETGATQTMKTNQMAELKK